MARMINGKSGNITVFGEETEFDGTLEFTDNLVIAGKFQGTINASGYLEIAKSAVCKVDKIKAQSIIVSGQVTGNLESSERVEMRTGSKIIGDVATARLRIADDVDFQGQVSMLDEIPSTDLFSLETSEYKQSLSK